MEKKKGSFLLIVSVLAIGVRVEERFDDRNPKPLLGCSLRAERRTRLTRARTVVGIQCAHNNAYVCMRVCVCACVHLMKW